MTVGVHCDTPTYPAKDKAFKVSWAQMYHLFKHNREKFLEHYHQRSNAETAYSMKKGKFGDSLRSKSVVGQINEALCKVLSQHLCADSEMHELGIEPAF
jgi:transposase